MSKPRRRASLPRTASASDASVPSLCSACWREMPIRASECPACGASAAALSLRSYEAKLRAALNHPIGEVRERAAVLLGRVGGPEMRACLLEMAKADGDPFLSAAALRGLQTLARRFEVEIDWAAFVDPGRAVQVRSAAERILQEEGLRRTGASGRGTRR